MRILIALMLTVATAQASAQSVYTDKKPEKELTKFEALKRLLATDNKATIYECKPKVVSSKGTLVNK